MNVIIDQPFGIGDILFLSPLVKYLNFKNTIWPVVDHYIWIKDYIKIKNLNFIEMSKHNNTKNFINIPFKDAWLINRYASDCMIAKYMLFKDVDFNIWKTLSFDRNLEKENKLKSYLGINYDIPYIFINNNFASREYNYQIDIKVKDNINIVKLEYIEGYTLLDWCGIIENAIEIHTVSTALFFMIEYLTLKTNKLHLYPRKPLDTDFSSIYSLIQNNNKWIYHE